MEPCPSKSGVILTPQEADTAVAALATYVNRRGISHVPSAGQTLASLQNARGPHGYDVGLFVPRAEAICISKELLNAADTADAPTTLINFWYGVHVAQSPVVLSQKRLATGINKALRKSPTG